MKKLLLLIILIIITGCNKKNIMVENTISIIYNEANINEEDFGKVTNIISDINFYCGKRKNYSDNFLTLSTKEKIYKIYLSNNYYMEYVENNNYCHTNDQEKVKELSLKLNKLIKSYYDTSYFTIRNEFNYQINETDTFIKLDNNKNYIIINSLYPLYNFKINQIEYNDKNKTYKETDLLYSIDFLDKDTNIVIKKEILSIPNYKISFKNKYGYFTNLLPFINSNNKINFTTEIAK